MIDHNPLLPLQHARPSLVENTKRVMVPLVVLRDHDSFDPLSDGSSDKPSLAALW